MNAKTKKRRVDQAVQAQARQARTISRQIHAWAERPFREVQSSQRLAAYLEEQGFAIEYPFKKIPTAFRAVWGGASPSSGCSANTTPYPVAVSIKRRPGAMAEGTTFWALPRP